MEAGWGWRWPYPFQAEQTIDFTQTQAPKEIGANHRFADERACSDSAMLTQDENIVDVHFSLQYSLKDARAFLFENSKSPEDAVEAGGRVGGARDRRLQPHRLGAVRAARRADGGADQDRSSQQLDTLDTPASLIANVNIKSVNPPEQVTDRVQRRRSRQGPTARP